MSTFTAAQWSGILLVSAVGVPLLTLALLDLIAPKKKSEPAETSREKSRRTHDNLADEARPAFQTNDLAKSLDRKRARKAEVEPAVNEVPYFEQDFQPAPYEAPQP